MSETEDDALADAIIAFFKKEYGRDLVISPIKDVPYWGPFQEDEKFLTETDAGCTFEIPISGPTRAAVAKRYFEHIRSVEKFVAEHWRSGSWLDGGRWFKEEERDGARNRLALLDEWAAKHLPPKT